MIDKLWMNLAWLLPRRLVYWCAVRLHAHATLPPWGDTEVPSLTALEAAKRWEA